LGDLRGKPRQQEWRSQKHPLTIKHFSGNKSIQWIDPSFHVCGAARYNEAALDCILTGGVIALEAARA